MGQTLLPSATGFLPESKKKKGGGGARVFVHFHSGNYSASIQHRFPSLV